MVLDRQILAQRGAAVERHLERLASRQVQDSADAGGAEDGSVDGR